MTYRLVMLALMISLSSIPTVRADDLKLTPYPETKQIDMDQDFSFTISPNGQELLFLGKDITKKPASFSLNVLNLPDGSLRRKDLNYQQWFQLHFNLTNDCWTEDSKLCLAPIPGGIKTVYPNVGPQIIVDLSDPAQLGLNFQLGALFGKGEFMKFDDFQSPFTCSDCMKGSEPHDKNGSRGRYSNGLIDPSTISPDKQFFYRVQMGGGIFGNEASVSIYDLSGNYKGELVHLGGKFGMGRPVIDRLRLSPSGRYLAFQVTYEAGFITPPELYVVNVTTHQLMEVAKNVYYDVHWTRDPERLYFYKCDIGGGCGGLQDYLYSVQID